MDNDKVMEVAKKVIKDYDTALKGLALYEKWEEPGTRISVTIEDGIVGIYHRDYLNEENKLIAEAYFDVGQFRLNILKPFNNLDTYTQAYLIRYLNDFYDEEIM